MTLVSQYEIEAIEISDIAHDTHYLNCIDQLHKVLSLVSFVVQGVKLEFISGVNLIYGIPDAIQKYPACFSLLIDFSESRIASDKVEKTYRTRHTVVFMSKNLRVAAVQAGLIVDAWPPLIRANRFLGGYLDKSGSCVMNRARGDFDRFNDANHQTLVFESTIKMIVQQKRDRWPTL